MSLQNERIQMLCEKLNLTAINNHYNTQAQAAAEDKSTYTDFLEKLLGIEVDEKKTRSRSLLTKMAAFPAIKTIDDFDFKFATGIPKSKVMELSSLAFIKRAETVVFLGPSGVGKHT